MWGIWCKDRGEDRGDWLRELPIPGYVSHAVLAFDTKTAACRRAAAEYGFDTYSEAKRHGWCEVRKLTEAAP